MFGLLPMGIYPWEYTHGNTPAEIQENGWMQAKASHTEQKGMEKMIKAGIIGATGYAGGELVRLLTAHPEVEIAWYGPEVILIRSITKFTGTCSVSWMINVWMIIWKNWRIWLT